MSGRRMSSLLLSAVLVGLLAAPLPAASAAEKTVSMVDHEYHPRELNVVVGDIVTWRNDELHDDDHTVDSLPIGSPGPLKSPQISRGQMWSFQFNEPGNFAYYCKVHGLEMRGIVRVREPGVPFAADDVLPLTKGSDPATGSQDVLANDEDFENDPLTVTGWQETTVKGGTVTCTADGLCTYTQASRVGCPDTDSFAYTISDGSTTDSATVEVRIVCAAGGGGDAVDSDVGLRLRRHLVARGAVKSVAAGCTRHRRVKIQRKIGGLWKTLETTESSDAGTYKLRLKDRPGTYRAKATATTLDSGRKCRAGTSSPTRHRH